MITRIAIVAVLCFNSARAFAAEAPQPDTDGFRRTVAPFFQKHCADCHGPDAQEAKLALHNIDANLVGGQQFEIWRMIREQLQFGDMPPQNEPQPDAAELQRVLD